MGKADRLAPIDWIKALASQFIFWHHLAFYGPMSGTAWSYAPVLIYWLFSYARIAVEAFVAAGGFLAARSLQRGGVPLAPPLRLPRPVWVAWLGVNSQAVFLIHYPVMVAVGAVVYRWWPANAGANAAGMAAGLAAEPGSRPPAPPLDRSA